MKDINGKTITPEEFQEGIGHSVVDTQEIQEWEKEFDEEFAHYIGDEIFYDWCCGEGPCFQEDHKDEARKFKSFISQKLKEQESNITEHLATMYRQGKAEGQYEAEERHKREIEKLKEQIEILESEIPKDL